MIMNWIEISITLAKILAVIGVNFALVMLLTLAERRISAFIQDRVGPNRVGPFGLLQPIADAIKMLFKEDITPYHVNKLMFMLAPLLVLTPALITFAVIPFGHGFTAYGREINLHIADVNFGILYIFALVSLGVYGIVLGGWASNSKYPLFGSLRSSAQMISYELSLGLSVIGVLMLSGSLRMPAIVEQQTHLVLGFLPGWNIFLQPLGFIIFIVAAFAETNRLPFDLPESEPELVAGYHTEYSSMKFGMFYMAEYFALITSSALTTTLFFGGWDVPWLDEAAFGAWGVVLSVMAFGLKTGFFLFLFLWVRWTLPRFRFDQLMHIGWKVLLPLGLINILLTAVVMGFLK